MKIMIKMNENKVTLPIDWMGSIQESTFDENWMDFWPSSIKKVHFLNRPLEKSMPIKMSAVVSAEHDIVIAVNDTEEEIYFTLDDESSRLDVNPLCLSDFFNLQELTGLDTLYDRKKLADLPDYIY